MVVKVSKPEINVREKISELDKPSGLAGQAMLAAETPQEQFNLISAGRRNLLINGAMKIDQRNGGSSITNTDNNLFPLDRWFINLSTEYNSSVSSGQNLDSLAPPPGFDKYIGVKIDSGTAAPAAPFLSIRQIIEGNNITHLDYGKSTAKDITISFWARTNHPGTYAVAVRGGTTQTACVTEFSVDSADTWQYISVIIPGQKDTTTTWPLDYVGEGLVVNIGLGSFQGTYSSSTLDQWVTGSFTGSATQTQDFAQTTGNTFYVTGVQLEVGKVATPFEHRSYGEELAECQRYYQKFPGALQIPGYQDGTSGINASLKLSPNMRAATPSTDTDGSVYIWRHNGFQSQNNPAIIVGTSTINGSSLTLSVNGWSGCVNGYVANLYISNLEIINEL